MYRTPSQTPGPSFREIEMEEREKRMEEMDALPIPHRASDDHDTYERYPHDLEREEEQERSEPFEPAYNYLGSIWG